MKSHPILFSPPMVLAIRDGRKTQTRRILKIPPVDADNQHADIDRAWLDPSYLKPELGNIPCVKVPYGPQGGDLSTTQRIFPPYAPGDQLWVKETYRAGQRFDDVAPISIPESSAIRYEADGMTYLDGHEAGQMLLPGRIRQSIFMRQWMSRLTLTITDVRIERLQDITEEDAAAEGIVYQPPTETDLEWHQRTYGNRNMTGVHTVSGSDCGFGTKPRHPIWGTSAKLAYRALWNSINPANEKSWQANPVVVAYTFTTKPQ